MTAIRSAIYPAPSAVLELLKPITWFPPMWAFACGVVSSGVPIGAHGIMTLNDFKSMGGDAQMGIRSLPVQLGAERAARVACAIMAAPQVLVIALLISWSQLVPAAIVTLFLAAQIAMMKRFIAAPVEKAIWYSGFGVPLFVFGMMASAFAVRGVI